MADLIELDFEGKSVGLTASNLNKATIYIYHWACDFPPQKARVVIRFPAKNAACNMNVTFGIGLHECSEQSVPWSRA